MLANWKQRKNIKYKKELDAKLDAIKSKNMSLIEFAEKNGIDISEYKKNTTSSSFKS